MRTHWNLLSRHKKKKKESVATTMGACRVLLLEIEVLRELMVSKEDINAQGAAAHIFVLASAMAYKMSEEYRKLFDEAIEDLVPDDSLSKSEYNSVLRTIQMVTTVACTLEEAALFHFDDDRRSKSPDIVARVNEVLSSIGIDHPLKEEEEKGTGTDLNGS